MKGRDTERGGREKERHRETESERERERNGQRDREREREGERERGIEGERNSERERERYGEMGMQKNGHSTYVSQKQIKGKVEAMQEQFQGNDTAAHRDINLKIFKRNYSNLCFS